MRKLKWFAANTFNLIGSLFIGLSLPLGINFLPVPDYYIFLSIGVIFVFISCYYKFIDRSHEENHKD